MRRGWLSFGLALLLVTGISPAVIAQRDPDFTVTQDPQEFVYFGSSKSNKFHRSDCQYVQRIKSGNLVGFRSREEALRMGYVPCKVCRP